MTYQRDSGEGSGVPMSQDTFEYLWNSLDEVTVQKEKEQKPGFDRQYEAEDIVSEALLYHVAKYIFPTELRSLGRDLKFHDAECMGILYKDETYPAFQLLKCWNVREIVKVKDLVRNMVVWQREGYLSGEIWRDSSLNINSDLLLTSSTTPQDLPQTDVPTLYEEDDRIDVFLINQVSKHVLFHKLGSLARQLRLGEATYSRINVALVNFPREQAFQVLYQWYNALPWDSEVSSQYNVKYFIENTRRWQDEGFIEDEVWTRLYKYVNPDLIPTITVTTRTDWHAGDVRTDVLTSDIFSEMIGKLTDVIQKKFEVQVENKLLMTKVQEITKRLHQLEEIKRKFSDSTENLDEVFEKCLESIEVDVRRLHDENKRQIDREIPETEHSREITAKVDKPICSTRNVKKLYLL